MMNIRRLLQLQLSLLVCSFFEAHAVPTTTNAPFTGGILSASITTPTSTGTAVNGTGSCNLAGPVNQTGSYLFTDINVVPPTSYFVLCSSYLSKYGVRPTHTQPIPTYVTPSGIVDCGSLQNLNQPLTGSTILYTFNPNITDESATTQACTAWAASRKSFADSPQGTVSALYSACQSQATNYDVQKDPALTGLTGSIVAQVYPGSLLPSDLYSPYHNATAFPIAYATNNPSGGVITTMPCRSFQAAYVQQYRSDASSYDAWSSSVISFWRSPQCTSAANAIHNNDTVVKRQLRFDEPNNINFQLGVPFGPKQVVHGVGIGASMATCCGPCQIIAQTLSMLYWPKGGTTPACSDGPVTSQDITSQVTLPPDVNLRLRAIPSGNESFGYTTLDGRTLISPSVYMAFQGSVWVSDLCGTLGSALTSLTVPVDPDMVSSIEFNPADFIPTYTNKPFDFDACPTFGWSDPFYTSFEDPSNPGSFTTFLTSTVGPPYHPIISPPPQLYVAEPAYSQCSAWRSAGYHAEPFYGAYDPPRALQPVSAMAAPTPPAAPPAQAITTSSAKPQQVPSPDLPGPTATPAPVAKPDTHSNSQPQQGGLPVIEGDQPWDSAPTPSSNSAINSGEKNPAQPAPGPKADSVPNAIPPASEGGAAPSGDPASGGNGAAPGGDSSSGQSGGSQDGESPNGESAASPDVDRPSGAAISVPNGGPDNSETPETVSGSGSGIVNESPGAAAPSGTIGGIAYSVDSSSRLVIHDKTLPPGSSATVQGKSIAFLPGGDGVVLGSSTQKFAAPALQTSFEAVMTYGGSTYTIGSRSEIAIEGQTLTPGKTIMVQGTPIAYAANGNGVVVGTSTQQLSIITPSPNQLEVMTLAGSTYTLGSLSELIIQGQTLTPGGTITIQGTPIAYPSSNAVRVGGSMQTFSDLAATAPAAREAVMTFAGSTFTAGASAFTIDGQTLSKGASIEVDGTPIVYPSNSDIVIIGTSTETLSMATPEAVITFAGSTYAEESSAFVIGSQTLTEGGKIIVNGTPISFAADGTDVIVGTSTEAVHLGSLILNGFGTTAPPAPTNLSSAPTNPSSTSTSAKSTANPPQVDVNIRLLLWSATVAIVFFMVTFPL